MNKVVIPTVMLFAAMAPLFGDSFSITVNITSSTDPANIPTGTYQGSFVTSGTCTLCTIGNGGIVSFDVPIHTGDSNTIFDALDGSNLLTLTGGLLIGTLPQYNTTSHLLSSSNPEPVLKMSENLYSSAAALYPSLQIEMTPTTLNAPAPTTCDNFGHGAPGCVSIHFTEVVVALGTYTITPQPATGGCPATIGFWKHHPFPNSVQQAGLTIGGITYSKVNLLTILNANGGNAVVILGRQLVGALLNLAAGGVHNSGADTAITTAQSLLQANALNLLMSNVPPSTQLGQSLVAQSTVLDNYNNADFNTCREGSGLVTGSK